MVILNQDRDELFVMGNVYISRRVFDNVLMGYTLFGYNNNKNEDIILATYDTEVEAKNVLYEIYKKYKVGFSNFEMPIY